MKKMVKKSLILFAFLFAFLLYLNSVSGVVQMVSPANGTNWSGTVTLNATYTNVTDMTSPDSGNSTFYQNGSGSVVAITCTSFTCSTTACWCSASASALTDGIDQTISVQFGNDSVKLNGTINSTGVDFYTTNISCSYLIDGGGTTVEYFDATGFTVDDASTKDSLTVITYNWTLYDEEGKVADSSTSTEPNFLEEDLDALGAYTLAGIHRDFWYNQVACTNTTVDVIGREAKGKEEIGEQAKETKKDLTTVFIIIGVIVFIIIISIIIALVAVEKSKRRR